MNLTNDDALDVMVSIGRQALERGKVDQALTILSGVVTKAPRHAIAWFSLARAHLAKGSRDHAAMCYQRASSLAATQKGAPAANLLSLSRDNMRLCAERVLPQDWLPALQDPHIADRWSTALEALAAGAAAATEAAADKGLRQPQGPFNAIVVGGVGLQAPLLQALLTAAHGDNGATAADGAQLPAPAAVTVTWVHPDELSRTLAAQMAAAAGVSRTTVRVVNGWEAAAAAVATPAATEVEPEASAGGGAAGLADVCVAAGVCTARLALREWAATLAKARPLLAPGAALCPSRLRLMGALVGSEDLTAMNEVRLDWMAEDSACVGGLQYGPANELLWRPARSMQVSGFRYNLMSEPFPLLPEVTARELLLKPEQLLGPTAALTTPDAAASTAAGASAAAAPPLPPSSRSLLRQPHDVIVLPTASGRVDAVVAWAEYELAPGVWLSYAPHEMQGRSDPPVLSPHVWQRVQYLSARPAVQAGQRVALQVTLSAGGDDLRVEYDEDVTAVQRLMTAVQRPAAAVAETATGGGDATDDSCNASSALPPGEPLLPEGEPLLQPGESSSGDEGERADAGGSDGGGAAPTAAVAATSVAAASQSGLILPYHMSMLNDRDRNRRYLRGIRGAVEAARARHPGEPLVVLDVGAGSGLLSMAAARAGAEMVVGCERELALAVTAGALTAANDLTDRVTVVQLHSKDLRVAPQAPAAATEEQQQQPEEQPQQQQQQDDPKQHGQPSQLPRRAGLVVHEIFGTDPLSEHILPSLAKVQEELAAPDAAFLPSGFRIVAALAHSDTLEARMRLTRLPPLGVGPGSGEAASAAAKEAARVRSVLPAAAAAALEPWAPWKAELDLMRLPDLLLLSEPVPVLSLRLGAGSRLPRGAYRAAAAAPPLRRPIPLTQRFRRHGPGGEELAPTAEPPPPASLPDAVTCVVYWFEADCGDGGWLSTCPGSPCTYFGHWVQNVHWLEEPLPLPTEMGMGTGEEEAGEGGVERQEGGAAGQGGEGAGERGSFPGALRVLLTAECVMDRVKVSAEWVVVGEEEDSSSSSSGGEEEEGRE